MLLVREVDVQCNYVIVFILFGVLLLSLYMKSLIYGPFNSYLDGKLLQLQIGC